MNTHIVINTKQRFDGFSNRLNQCTNNIDRTRTVLVYLKTTLKYNNMIVKKLTQSLT